MALLGDVCDPALVDEAVGAGLVSVQAEGLLRILNYTAKATYSRSWNEATIAGLRGQGEDPVEGLRAQLPEEFLPWYDSEVGACTARAGDRIRLYESLARQASANAIDDSDRAFAAVAQRLAADNGVHPGPVFALRKGRADARLAIWAQTKPSGLGDRATATRSHGGPEAPTGGPS